MEGAHKRNGAQSGLSASKSMIAGLPDQPEYELGLCKSVNEACIAFSKRKGTYGNWRAKNKNKNKNLQSFDPPPTGTEQEPMSIQDALREL